ncbi:MAG: geranylgeranyl reductase family protein [Candidatus Aminicenantes bacterium]|jgi:geranylgeranyl reductase family protein
MPSQYDVVIVGAGPAGSTAAYILSQKDYKVMLLEKEHFPRKKLCGGCLTAKTLWLVNRVFNEPEESLTKKNIINFKSFRFDVRYKTKVLVSPISPLAFHFVDRQVYDSFLLRKAQEAGAQVSEGEELIHIDALGVAPPNDYASRNENKALQSELILTTSQGRLIKTKFIIGADGANSTVRTKLLQQKKINSSRWHRNLAYGLEIFLARNGDFKTLEFPILSFGYLRYGYAWIFPNKDRLVVGIGGLKRKNKNLPGKFKKFLSDYHLEGIDSYKIQGYPLPFGNALSTPVYRNILLVGDAAGLVDPMLGEGIYQAHKSGELAAKAIIETLENPTPRSPGTHYLNLLQQHLMTEFLYALRFRWFLYNPLSHFLNFRHIKLMDRYFGKLSEVVHGSRTYKWFKKK